MKIKMLIFLTRVYLLSMNIFLYACRVDVERINGFNFY